ncbi:RagB/SusD family nutrient uptake outer membrane protein [Flavobacterium sp. AC]|uniref:RagB/SusD family nutrient uptake outer membrane protein n=1 Tax=Flavobacterium azizsancarii TaxID=2961580 RepID=A0ABT4WFT2_9FLAO|nr:RagB/SusD family nutrient uptake outer membrane protein [Flavobacterium azizsancarii]MDA6071321.1 RagB/SusD family nutrient uptake outer membrane protein [Flavobacterium azizsancarii]
MKIKILTAMAFVMLFASCSDFLEQDPNTSLTEEQAFSTLKNIDPIVLGMYISWRNIQKDRGGLMFQLGTDETQQGALQVMTTPGQAGLDYYNGFLSKENTALAEQWDSRWPVVSTAAKAIFALNKNTEADIEKRKILLGEASFIRATIMFELTQYWGEIPILDETHSKELGHGRQPLKDVYAFIINDLKVAEENLPLTQKNPSFPVKYLAQALLGKVYLYAPEASGAHDYTLAKEAFAKVINSGKYNLLATYADVFSPDHANSSESLYEFQFTNDYPDNNQIQWQTGSRALANIDQYAYFGGYDLLLPTKYCYNDKTSGGIWESGDKRKDASIRYDFTYKGIVPTIPSGFGGDELDPHIKKYEDIRIDGKQSFWNSGKNKPYIRYSDVLLCYAECLNELGNTPDAEGFVNQVRKRGFGGSLPAGMEWSGLSKEQFKEQMLDERMRELAFEGWRRMDLIRSGKLVQYVKARNKWTAESGTIAEFHTRYPIPLVEIQLNDDISDADQNPGY